MPCRAAEQHIDFIQQDKMILKNNGYGKIIGLYCYHDDWKIILADKYPIKNEDGRIIALVSYISDMTHSNIIDINQFISLTSCDLQQKGYFIDESSPELPKRASECVFFLIRGHSAKEIAKILNLSPRTVESYFEQLKTTWNCQNKSELIQKALSLGFMNKIPKTLLLGA